MNKELIKEMKGGIKKMKGSKTIIPWFLYKPPYGFPRDTSPLTLRQFAKNPYIFAAIKTIEDEVCSIPYDLKIDNEGVKINGIPINEEIFNQEKVDYRITDREDQVEHLCMWISEAGQDRENDKRLMLEDLKYLCKLEDEYIFSSISTNEYIAKSDDEERFNEICEEILKLNEEIE
jgi:hypothetical protein